MLLKPTGTGAGGGSEEYTAGEALLLGDLIAIDTAGEARKADLTFANALYSPVGIAIEAASLSGTFAASLIGKRAAMRMDAVPNAADNGKLVYLSTTPGVGSLNVPSGSGRVVLVVGVLQGADGLTSTPEVVLSPQYITRYP